MNDYQKKQYAITKILEALNVLEAKKQYDLEKVKKACEIIIQNDYVNEWYWKKSLRHKHKVAQVKVLHNVDFVSIYIIVSDNQEKRVKEVLAIQEKPDEWFYAKYLGTLQWVSDNEVQLISKEKEIVAKVLI